MQASIVLILSLVPFVASCKPKNCHKNCNGLIPLSRGVCPVFFDLNRDLSKDEPLERNWMGTLARKVLKERPSGDLMTDAFDWMIKTDTEKCYERMICDIASKDQTDASDLKKFLNDEAMFDEEFAAKLSGALELGKDAKNYEACEEAYECPFDAKQISTMMQEQFEDSTDDN